MVAQGVGELGRQGTTDPLSILFEPELLASIGVTRLGDLTGLDVIGIPVWFASRPNSYLLSQTQGKGLTNHAAQVSAVMEAAEHHFAERACDLPTTIVGTLRQMQSAGAPLIPIDRVAGSLNPDLDLDRERVWCAGTSLLSGAPCIAPYELVGLDGRLDEQWDRQSFQQSTVGLGADLNPDGATLQALCEVIENDASALIDAMGPLKPLMVPLAHIPGEHKGLDEAVDKLAHAGMSLEFAALPSHYDLPAAVAFVAPSRASGLGASHQAFAGFACRPSLADAVFAAVLEAVQSRLTDIAGSRDDIDPGKYNEGFATLSSAPSGKQSISELPFETDLGSQFSSTGKLKAILDHLANRRVSDIFRFDLTQAGQGIHVVRVIVPGLSSVSEDTSVDLGVGGIKAILNNYARPR